MPKIIYIPESLQAPLEVKDVDLTAPILAYEIGAQLVERVRIGDFRHLPPKSLEPMIMLVDEEGVLRARSVNLRASVLYGATVHDNLIYGPVVLVRERLEYTNEGPDMVWYGFTDDDEITSTRQDLEAQFKAVIKLYETPA